jgi:AraC-like DNA-binding protein
MISPPRPSTAHLPLHEWAGLRSELVWIYDRPVRPQYRRTRGEPLPGYRAWFLRRGSVAITSGRRTLHAARGSWIMLPQAPTAHDFSRDATLLSVNFVSQWPSGESLLVLREPIIVPGARHPALTRDATRLERLLRRQFPHDPAQEQMLYGRESAEYGIFLQLQGLFYHWLAGWFQICLDHGARLTRLSSGDTRPFQAARCLNQAPLDHAFPAEWLQRETGLGLMRLNQLFFREFGLTTRKYWDRRRLDFARQCLETSQMPMKEISYRLNFRSDSHFVIWFRRLSGSRPGEYRRRYLGSVRAPAGAPRNVRNRAARPVTP